jgi:hypothetical protein
MFFDGNAKKYFVVENGIKHEKFYTSEFPILRYSDDSKHLYYLDSKEN